MIKLKNVEKAFQSKAGAFYVLRRIELEVKEGEFITVMGPSGSLSPAGSPGASERFTCPHPGPALSFGS